MRVQGKPALEAHEQVLAVRVDVRYGASGEPLWPPVQSVQGSVPAEPA